MLIDEVVKVCSKDHGYRGLHHSFSSTDYFFVSTNIARRCIDIPESAIVLAYSDQHPTIRHIVSDGSTTNNSVTNKDGSGVASATNKANSDGIKVDNRPDDNDNDGDDTKKDDSKSGVDITSTVTETRSSIYHRLTLQLAIAMSLLLYSLTTGLLLFGQLPEAGQVLLLLLLLQQQLLLLLLPLLLLPLLL